MVNKQICWSFDLQEFNYKSLNELINARREDISPGITVYFADILPVSPKKLCNAMDVLAILQDNAYIMAGGNPERFIGVGDNAFEELNVFLDLWIRKHCNIDFYSFENVRAYALTEDDFIQSR